MTLSLAADSEPVGAGTTVRLTMSTTDDSTCSLGIAPRLLEARITGPDKVVWQSRSCPDALAAQNVVVRPEPAAVYSFSWDGRESTNTCSSSGEIAQPGTYWATAAVIGGEPKRVRFEVTEPNAARQ